jgi:hypothetical protein
VEYHDIGTYEMWARAKGFGTISTNATIWQFVPLDNNLHHHNVHHYVVQHCHSLHSTCMHIVMAENATKSTMVEGNKHFIKEFDHATNNIIPSKFNFKKFKIHLKNCYELKIDTTIEQLNKE